MKLIGKQIVVELPEERKPSEMLGWTDKDIVRDIRNELKGYNFALSEVARMNPAWEVDEEALSKEIQKYFGIIEVHPDDMIKFDVAKTVEKLVNWRMTNGLAQAIASELSKWLKRKEN